jgi:hypothetical protein
LLITWYDRHAATEEGDTPFGGAPSDVRATLYGVPETTTSTTSIVPTTTTTTSTVQNPCLALKIYGEHSEEVEFLRQVRDNVLNKTAEGRELIKLYYEWSPAIVKALEGDEKFKGEIKEIIDGILPLIR